MKKICLSENHLHVCCRLAAGNCAPKCQPCCPAPAKRCCTAPAKRCCTMPSKPCCPPAKGKNGSPAQTKRINSSRRACLIARYSFIFAHERMDAEATLRTFICDMELVQRIIYIAALECFRVAKTAFWKIKTTVKHNLSLTHSEPPPLDVAVLDYIIYHKDVYDVFESVHEVICAMDMNPKISYPPVVDFVVITTLIKELCAVAFAMQTLDPPLDVTCGIDGELFNRTMYYRSSDSDHTAGYVAYHVWPPLMENGVVIVKGEVVTRSLVRILLQNMLRESLSLLNPLSQKSFVKLFSCRVFAKRKVEAEAAAVAVVSRLVK
uniref:Mitochondria-eating protein n=1 Tax=Malurus cyaneus samueli TaxID=2593467 RepID=A0A8C5T214_9PASS